MTAIQWTDVTWNPVRGCSRVSPGCENCYAERQAARPILSAPGKPYHGLVTLRSRASGLRYEDPGAAGSWTAPRWSGKVVLDPEVLAAPLRWKKPRRVFVNSMSDMFHESLTDEQIAAVFGVMAATPQHTYQVLTKRAERMARWFEWIDRPGVFDAVTWCIADFEAITRRLAFSGQNANAADSTSWPLRNVWLGVSVEDQQRADERIPHLLRCPAAVRFLSVEPLLGPVDLRRWFNRGLPSCEINWVIVGGESGPGARPCDVAWIRSIVAQCRAAGVPTFVKQLGANPRPDTGDAYGADDARHLLAARSRKGGCMVEWPEDLRVREWPSTAPKEPK